ncbi:MAG: heavy metal-associated domain-containing protein [Bacteroidota bacterium]
MKATFKSFLGAFILIAILSASFEAAAIGKSKVVNIKTSAICGSCKARIEKALASAEGVEAAVLNLNSKQVKVKYDPAKTSPEKLREVVAGTGYSADDVKANEEAFNKLPGCCKKQGSCAHAKE